MALTRDAVVRWLQTLGRELAENRAYLTELDRPIGDSDHGINMDRGFQAVVTALEGQPGVAQSGDAQSDDAPAGEAIDAILKATGMTLIRTVGGASGPLYGTVFLRMAGAVAGKDALDEEAVGTMLEAGRKGIVDRGKAAPGDKTMLDAWDPAVNAYQEAAGDGKGLTEALGSAADAAEEGMKATTPLVARKGRASYLGERSAGHQDPGATSSYLFFKTLRDVASG